MLIGRKNFNNSKTSEKWLQTAKVKWRRRIPRKTSTVFIIQFQFVVMGSFIYLISKNPLFSILIIKILQQIISKKSLNYYGFLF